MDSGRESPARGLITDGFIRLVESQGAEIGVTVVVGGTAIEGIMCPVSRLAEWQTETLHRFLLGEGSSFPATDMPPPTSSQREAAKAEFIERTRDYIQRHGAAAPMTFRTFALRNATIRTGEDPARWIRLPFLLVDAHRVAAIALGTTSPP